MFIIFDAIGVDLGIMEELHLIRIAVACVPSKGMPSLKKAMIGYPLVFHRCYLRKDTDFVCLAFPSKHNQAVEKILKTHHGEMFETPHDFPRSVTQALSEVTNRIIETQKKEADVNASLKKLGKSNQQRLIALEETSNNILVLLQAKKKFFNQEGSQPLTDLFQKRN